MEGSQATTISKTPSASELGGEAKKAGFLPAPLR